MAGAALFGRRMIWRVGTVVALHDETPTARTIELEVSDWPGHVAGQHVDVRLTAMDGYSAVRSYSIASAPKSDSHIELTVERLPSGEVSPYLTQQLATRDRLELRGPIGGWFVWRREQTEPVQLVAGGSGMVPLMAMIRSRTESGSTAPFRLLYSVREPGVVLYRDELQGLSDPHSCVVVTYAYTRRAPRDWPRPPGRIDAAVIANAAWPSTFGPTCYVCGPTPFVEAAAGLLSDSGTTATRSERSALAPRESRDELTPNLPRRQRWRGRIKQSIRHGCYGCRGKVCALRRNKAVCRSAFIHAVSRRRRALRCLRTRAASSCECPSARVT